ncbi:MAG TPA: 1,2-phenylacetyl-CoA epoxidase subunit PaaC [Candidatus Sulfomarinibacteraceae bacterium]|nr:1,2-phenylacetyl-CoA epoxidase subunit PaaC [Candidatus Sulfomarinibacteraceae bacterium]
MTQALERKLLALADDELILAHRNSEWCGHAPILEEDIAFANIAQDELGHARLWYECLAQLNGADVDRLVFFRDAGEYRNVRLVELPRGDWAFSMMRQYLFDVYEMVALEALAESAHQPLAQVAAKARQEEQYHLRHSSAWIRRLGLGTQESNRRTQQALDALWAPAYQLFAPLPGEAELVQAGMVPAPVVVRQRWEEIVGPFLEDAGLRLPPEPADNGAGRDVHTEHLEPLLAELQEVARQDPQAEW